MRPTNATIVVEDGERLPQIFAEWLETRARKKAPGPFSLAVPGGSVAERFLPALGPAPFAPDLHVFWVDERVVPASDPASNYGLAKRLWLEPAGIAPERVHPMVPDGRPLDLVVRAAARELERTLGNPPRLDVALLGVGEDGHVASLFPGHPVLAEAGWVSALADAPKPPPERLTLTLPVLLGARVVLVGAFGRPKAKVIGEVLSGGGLELPLGRVVAGARECVFFLDREAAGALD